MGATSIGLTNLMPSLFAFLFSTPFSAAVVTAGAVAVPIVIHLLNRKRFRVITWAAMRFLLNAQKKNARRNALGTMGPAGRAARSSFCCWSWPWPVSCRGLNPGGIAFSRKK